MRSLVSNDLSKDVLTLSLLLATAMGGIAFAHGCDTSRDRRNGKGEPEAPTVAAAKGVGSCQGWQRPFQVTPAVFPFESKCLATSKGRIHYFDAGPRDAMRTIVAFHGNPVWSVVFTPLARKAVAAGMRFVAMDYLGYGMSDKPDPSTFDYLISSQSAVAGEFLRALDLRDVTLLVQDGGGPVGLGAAAAQPERVRDLVVINTWFRATPPIADGGTAPQFVFHDWSLDNIVNETYFTATGFNAYAGARGAVRDFGFTAGTPEGEQVRAAFLSPYFEDGAAGRPRGPSVHLPHVRFVQSVLKDRAFFERLESTIGALAAKPVAFHFTEPTAFGALKCDAGPRTRIDLTTPDATRYGAVPLSARRAACPAAYTCSETPPRPFQSTCRGADGKEERYLLASFLQVWRPEAVVRIDDRDVPASEYLALKEPDAILRSIEALEERRRK